jgi:hypothetical protein
MHAYRCCALLLAAICCLGLWIAPAVPMQDYPQHLFVSAVLQGGAHASWAHDYDAALGVTPYSGIYWLLGWLTPVFGLDGAGRALITAYFALFAWLTVRLSGIDKNTPPWSALWLFPFALNQAYFHGFLNYLITLPLLLIALSQLRHAQSRSWQRLDVLSHAAVLVLILWFHPLTIYVYAGLALCELALSRASHTGTWLRAAPLLAVAALLVSWQVGAFRDRTGFVYWPLADTSAYFGQLFLGLRADPLSVLLHALGCALVGLVLVRIPKQAAITRRDLLQLSASVLAYFALPYQVGSYSCVNWRLAPLPFLLLALMLARVALPRRAAWLVSSVAVAFTCDASYLQLQVGRESAEILLLADSVAKQRSVVALALDASSKLLHPQFFYLMHRHEIFYYQLASGALSPHLWRLPLMPVRYRAQPPPREPRSVAEIIQQNYPLVFARGATPELAQALGKAYRPQQANGSWVVFERQRVAAATQHSASRD